MKKLIVLSKLPVTQPYQYTTIPQKHIQQGVFSCI